MDLDCGELRLIEMKGLSGPTGTVMLTLNEERVAEDRRGCYWRYIVTNCNTEPQLQEPTKDPARLQWHELTKVAHYSLLVDALMQPTQVREHTQPYGGHE